MVRGDIDGFFGLFIDNLLQLMLIAVLCPTVAGLPREFVTSTLLPGAAASILIGNLFYAAQARRLARETGRTDVTALPYGINTPSLIAFIFLIMGPIYRETGNTRLAWQAGLLACLINGVMEIGGAFVGDWLRRHTPRAALLTSLAGVAITFIAMGFVFQIYASPELAILPMIIILTTYAAKVRWPGRIPGGFLGVLVGILLFWWIKGSGATVPTDPVGWHFPRAVPRDLLALIMDRTGWQYLAVIVPMGLFNVIGSLQNLESAAAAGDHFPTKPSLLVNGFCGVLAALLGSPFPTTIYIGHPAWKAMGARSGYSILNGVVIMLLCLTGSIALVLQFVPLEATLGILLWIGIVMTAQAFSEVPKSHTLAVALGLMPALASWALLLIETTLRVAGSSLQATVGNFGQDLYIHGVIALSQGFLLSSMILAAMMVHIIEREFLRGAVWALVAALFSLTGLIHGYEMTAAGVQNSFGWMVGGRFAVGYGLAALVLFGLSKFPPPCKGRVRVG